MSEVPGSEPCNYSEGACILYSVYCGPRQTCILERMSLPKQDDALTRYRRLREEYIDKNRDTSYVQYPTREPGPGDNN
jgi:hypothetical protein